MENTIRKRPKIPDCAHRSKPTVNFDANELTLGLFPIAPSFSPRSDPQA